MKPDMKVRLAGIELVNPVVAASGTFGYGIEFEEIVSLEAIGGFVTKGISLHPMSGHAAPRLIHTAAGMRNAIGLQNVGVDDFIDRGMADINAQDAASFTLRVLSEFGLLGYLGVLFFVFHFHVGGGARHAAISNAILVSFFLKLVRGGIYFPPEQFFFIIIYLLNYRQFARGSRAPVRRSPINPASAPVLAN